MKKYSRHVPAATQILLKNDDELEFLRVHIKVMDNLLNSKGIHKKLKLEDIVSLFFQRL